jgi:hypothetical protein
VDAPIDRGARIVPEIVLGHMFFFVSARKLVSHADDRASQMRRGLKIVGCEPKTRAREPFVKSTRARSFCPTRPKQSSRKLGLFLPSVCSNQHESDAPRRRMRETDGLSPIELAGVESGAVHR